MVESALGMEMIWVETNTDGEPVTLFEEALAERDRLSNEEEHNVTFTNSFYLGKYEVTQASTKQLCEVTNLDSTQDPVNQHKIRTARGKLILGGD